MQDFGHLARAAGCAASIGLAKLPVSEAAKAAIALDAALKLLPAIGGDDYELAFAAPAAATPAVEEAARAAGIALTQVGELRAGEAGDVSLLDERGRRSALPAAGWSHF